MAISLFVWWPRTEKPQPQKHIANIEAEFKADDYLFADARKRCREAIRKIEPGAKFGSTEDRKYKKAVISRIDWKVGKVEHRSYCKVLGQEVRQLTIDNAVAR